ncbi:hypothetical protein B0H11DRAFT_1901725 [Mycena galericulata]|nr:hypothetical protein B0H11DRAFT_1901725 [Mycena galericulata]
MGEPGWRRVEMEERSSGWNTPGLGNKEARAAVAGRGNVKKDSGKNMHREGRRCMEKAERRTMWPSCRDKIGPDRPELGFLVQTENCGPSYTVVYNLFPTFNMPEDLQIFDDDDLHQALKDELGLIRMVTKLNTVQGKGKGIVNILDIGEDDCVDD